MNGLMGVCLRFLLGQLFHDGDVPIRMGAFLDRVAPGTETEGIEAAIAVLQKTPVTLAHISSGGGGDITK